jgi:ribonuclease P protein component
VATASSTFPKTKRLLRRADFQRVYESGRRQFTGNMTVFFLRRNDCGVAEESSLRVGLTVGRVLGNAVARNRIKRRMREAIRHSWPETPAPVDVIFHPRKSVIEMAFVDVAREVGRGLQLAIQRAREPGQPVKP